MSTKLEEKEKEKGRPFEPESGKESQGDTQRRTGPDGGSVLTSPRHTWNWIDTASSLARALPAFSTRTGGRGKQPALVRGRTELPKPGLKAFSF